MSDFLEACGSLAPGHPSPFLVPLLAVMVAAALLWQGRTRGFNPALFFGPLACLSLMVGVASSTRMVVAMFQGLAASGSGGLVVVAAGLYEAAVLVFPGATGALCIGVLSLIAAPRIEGVGPTLFPTQTEAPLQPIQSPSHLAWVILFVSLILSALLTVWQQTFLSWLLDVVAGRSSLALGQITALTAVQALTLRGTALAGILFSLVTVVVLYRRVSRGAGPAAPPRFGRIAGVAIVLVALLTLVRSSQQQSLFYRAAQYSAPMAPR